MKINLSKIELVEISNKLNCEPKDFIRKKDPLLKELNSHKINNKDFMIDYIKHTFPFQLKIITVSMICNELLLNLYQ